MPHTGTNAGISSPLALPVSRVLSEELRNTGYLQFHSGMAWFWRHTPRCSPHGPRAGGCPSCPPRLPPAQPAQLSMHASSSRRPLSPIIPELFETNYQKAAKAAHVHALLAARNWQWCMRVPGTCCSPLHWLAQAGECT